MGATAPPAAASSASSLSNGNGLAPGRGTLGLSASGVEPGTLPLPAPRVSRSPSRAKASLLNGSASAVSLASLSSPGCVNCVCGADTCANAQPVGALARCFV